MSSERRGHILAITEPIRNVSKPKDLRKARDEIGESKTPHPNNLSLDYRAFKTYHFIALWITVRIQKDVTASSQKYV